MLTQAGLEKFFAAVEKQTEIKSIMDEYQRDYSDTQDLLAAASLVLRPIFGNIPFALKHINFDNEYSLIAIGFPPYTDNENRVEFPAENETEVLDNVTKDLWALMGNLLSSTNTIRVTPWSSGDQAGINAISIMGPEVFAAFRSRIEEAYAQILSQKRLLPAAAELDSAPAHGLF